MDKHEILKRFFGYDSFRPGQEELIDGILGGNDALGIMPTGGGKSMCYQIPAALLPGVTLVISPLISLMKDQVAAASAAGISAGYINSSLSAEQLREVYRRAYQGRYKLLYIAPERLEAEGFQRLAREISIPLIAVDEAHCVSQWGQDFRPSYLRIAEFIELLPRRPVVAAFTATATERVRKDILKHLKLEKPICTVTGFDRPNLYFEVRHPQKRTEELYEILDEHAGLSGIVYCSTRKTVELICASLCHRGYSATRYHAGLDDEERRENQEDFQFDRKTVMVATNAFGMGIDKSNVGFVIHYNMPKSLEAYYQEAGRAGRDGSKADCILLYSPADVETARFLIESSENPDLSDGEKRKIKAADYERLRVMRDYCKTEKCLRAYILAYFGQSGEDRCMNCGSCRSGYRQQDITRQAQMILSCAVRIKRSLGYGVGKTLLVQVLRGSGARRVLELGLDGLSTYGLMKDIPDGEVRGYIDFLEARGFLKTNLEHGAIEADESSKGILYGGEQLLMPVKIAQKPETPKNSRLKKLAPGGPGGSEERALFEVLRALRMKIAREEGVPAYFVLSNASLEDMTERRPRSMHEFLQVSGIGEKRAGKYAAAFIDKIREFENK